MDLYGLQIVKYRQPITLKIVGQGLYKFLGKMGELLVGSPACEGNEIKSFLVAQ